MSVPKQIENIQCEYENRLIISDIDFEVKKGSHVALLGPSGCGKTTILKAIAGLPLKSWDNFYRWKDRF